MNLEIPSRIALTVDGARRFAPSSDGMSNTLLNAEVKTFQPRLRCGGRSVNDPFNEPVPNSLAPKGLQRQRLLVRDQDAHLPVKRRRFRLCP
jgi:hypothetical protein